MDPVHVQIWCDVCGHIAISTALPRQSGVARRCWYGTRHGTLGGSRWEVIAERDRSRAIDRMPMWHVQTLYICIIPVVNKSLSSEVPYAGRFWQRNATDNNKHDSTHEQPQQAVLRL